MMVFNFQIWRLCEKIDLYLELKHMTELTNIHARFHDLYSRALINKGD